MPRLEPKPVLSVFDLIGASCWCFVVCAGAPVRSSRLPVLHCSALGVGGGGGGGGEAGGLFLSFPPVLCISIRLGGG